MSPLRHAERPAAAPVAPATSWRDVPETWGRKGDRHPHPAAVAIGLAEARVTRRRRSIPAEIGRWLLTAIVFALLAAGLLAVSLVAAIYWQARSDQTRPVDAIVVLGTAQFNGRPGAVLQARLNRAIEAYRAGTAPLIVATGGRASGDAFTEAEAARDYLIAHGIPAASILMENEGRDTWDSLGGVASLLKERGLSRTLMVSDGFHLFRVKLMARDLGLTPFAAPATTSPIRQGGGTEFSYVLREAAAVAVHLWRTR